MVKNLPVNAGDSGGSSSIPRSGTSTGEGNGNLQRSLVGYSPQGHKESDMTDHTRT